MIKNLAQQQQQSPNECPNYALNATKVTESLYLPIYRGRTTDRQTDGRTDAWTLDTPMRGKEEAQGGGRSANFPPPVRPSNSSVGCVHFIAKFAQPDLGTPPQEVPN